MTITFDPTKKSGRFIYRVYGMATFLRHPDGRPASETEADAMAQGCIPCKPERVEEMIALIETIRDTRNAIWKAYSNWTQTAKPYEYGAQCVWIEFEIRRSQS